MKDNNIKQINKPTTRELTRIDGINLIGTIVENPVTQSTSFRINRTNDSGDD